MASSGIEEIIDEIEDYIDSCKPATFSQSKITVNRDELESLLSELRSKTPEEIRRYQKIISNKEAILADAHNKADQIIAQAQIQTDQLVSEHQIMQQAYAKANEVVMLATKNAQDMLDKATADANDIRQGAIAYTDELLKNIEIVLTNSMETTQARTETYLNTMQQYLDVVVANRQELNPTPEPTPVVTPAPKAVEKPVNEPAGKNSSAVSQNEEEELPSIDIPESFFNKS